MTTRSNKKFAAIILALSAGMLLAGCDSIEALPNNYETPIMDNQNGTKVDVYNNIMGVLYDAASTGKTTDVLNNFMNIVANDQFGTFAELKAVYESKDPAKYKDFVSKHKIFVHEKTYQILGGEITEDEYLAKKFDTTVDKIQAERVDNFYLSVNKKINEDFYTMITSKTYNDDTGKFYENRLAVALYGQMYNINLLADGWHEGYITPELKKEDVGSLIHFDDGRYDDYINRKVVRSVYRDKLVEDYLIRNNYSTLGRAYGRKVNIVKLTRDEKFKDLPSKLLNVYADAYIKKEGSKIDFEMIANAWRGFKGVDKDGQVIPVAVEEVELLKEAGYTLVENAKIEGQSIDWYFKETKFGQLIEDYNKIDEGNRFASEEAITALNKFTGNLTYTKEKGLKIELAKLALEDYTTDGYYVKNGGLTDLPEKIRNRLFNINVSNEVDKAEEYEKGDYTKYINGHYYLTPAVSESGDDKNYIIFDTDSYYVVEVVEAPSTSKLTIDNASGYVATRTNEGALFTEEVARELARTLGTKDSYIDSAYAYYIEKYSVMYHDSSIYNFFKEKFPELFE